MSMANLKVLVVDDFELARNLMKNALADVGIKNVEEAENGGIALQKLESAFSVNQPFDIIFSDWHMPEVTGYDFLKKCQENPKFQHVPFVMVSAETETEAIVEALKSGAVDFLSKPIGRDSLARKIEKIITQKLKKAA